MRIFFLIGAIVVASALAGCGSDSSDAGSTATSSPLTSSGMVAPGGGLSVSEAISTSAEPSLAVTGWVVVSGADVRLCSGYRAAGASDSCVEPSLALKGASSAKGGDEVSLFGAVEGNVFVVSATVQG